MKTFLCLNPWQMFMQANKAQLLTFTKNILLSETPLPISPELFNKEFRVNIEFIL